MWAGRDGAEAVRSLEELALLAESAGLEPVDRMSQELKQISAATRIGKGKVEQLKELVGTLRGQVVVFDDPLTPAQRRNLEAALEVKVIDRSQLILDIFAQRATTRAGKIQVELAQLQYLLPRLTRQWTHLSRIRGGVGMRGPGETQLEVDRRQVRVRIAGLKRQLGEIDRTRRLNRQERSEIPYPTVALVGYTNAGKSSLMNRLTGADVYVADKLFATLDTTVRRMALPGGSAVTIADTVGFVAKLPHELVEAFKGTLEQVVEADCILHVVDSADAELEARVRVVEGLLEELGASTRPTLLVYNKSDLAAAVAPPPGALAVSAHTGAGCDALLQAIEETLRLREQQYEVLIPYHDARMRAWLYEHARVVGEAAEEAGSRIVVWMTAKTAGRLERMLSPRGSEIRHT